MLRRWQAELSINFPCGNIGYFAATDHYNVGWEHGHLQLQDRWNTCPVTNPPPGGNVQVLTAQSRYQKELFAMYVLRARVIMTHLM
jgi:hypothetical protein